MYGTTARTLNPSPRETSGPVFPACFEHNFHSSTFARENGTPPPSLSRRRRRRRLLESTKQFLRLGKCQKPGRGFFFPPLARDTSGAALTEDTARKRGKTTKQIKQTTTVGGLAICARAWKCFVPSLLFSLIEFCPDDDFFFFFGLVDISIAYSFF